MQLPRPQPTAEQHKRSWPLAAAPDTQYSGAAGALNVLIVEDDDPVREVCASYAKSIGCRVRVAASLSEARPLLRGGSPDVILLDLHLPDGSGSSLLDEIQRDHPRAMITVMSAHATVTLAMDMMSRGATHVLEKPFTLHQVSSTLERAAERREQSKSTRTLQDRLQAGVAPGRLVARSPCMAKLLSMISKVAGGRHPVLITGEPGSGKETVARTIHANGPSAVSSFLPVDCDALDHTRLETELFGDPVSSDASRQQGLLASAAEGTLFLSEISAMAPPLQARLLRVLETRQIRSTHGGPALPFRARLIACASQELEPLVQSGKFRRDLFYKLNVTHLRVPPLRDRMEDLAPLAEAFLEEQRRQQGTHFAFSEGASQSMLRYPWPGNVAELETAIGRACYLAQGSVVHLDDLISPVRNYQPSPEARVEISATENLTTFATLDAREREAISAALRMAADDKAAAARLLGIGKTTLYRKLKEYSLALDVDAK